MKDKLTKLNQIRNILRNKYGSIAEDMINQEFLLAANNTKNLQTLKLVSYLIKVNVTFFV
jgi:hypothetical protein